MVDKLYQSGTLGRVEANQQRAGISQQVQKALAFVLNHGRDPGIDVAEASDIVASFEHSRMIDVVTDLETIFRSQKTKFGKQQYTEPPKMVDTYTKLYNQGFFDMLHQVAQQGTVPRQTGRQLIKNVIKLNEQNNIQFNYTRARNTASINTMVDTALAMQDALKNGGLFATFDTETLSGKNAYGYNELDSLTDFSFTIRDGAGNEVDNFQNIIGIDAAERDRLRAEVMAMKDRYDLTENERVKLGRLSKMGHPDVTVKEIQKAGVAPGSIWGWGSSVDDSIELTQDQRIENALRGIDNSFYVGEQQRKAANGGELYWKQQYRDMVNIMNGTHKDPRYKNLFTTGFNDSNFDIPVLNRFAARTPGLNDLHISPANHLDMYHMVQNVTAVYGNNHLYKDRLKDTIAKFGANQQEQLTRFFFPDEYADGSVAHVAEFDERMLSKLFTTPVTDAQGRSYTIFDQLTHDLQNIQQTALGGKYTGPNQQLFMMNQSTMFDSFNRKGGMSFVYDPVSKTYKTLNGYEVGDLLTEKDGTAQLVKGARKSGITQSGIRKGALYTHNVVRLDTTDAFKNLVGGTGENATMQDYAMNSMYAVISTPIYDKSDLKNAVGHTTAMDGYVVSFYETIEQVEGLLNGGVVAGVRKDSVGAYDFGKMRSKNAWEEVDETFNHPDFQWKWTEASERGTPYVFTDRASMNDFFDKSMDRNINDYAANLTRDMTYGKYIRTKKAIKKIESQPGRTIEAKLAGLVSKNQPLTLGLFQELSVEDFVTGGRNMWSNSVNNTVYVRNHFNSMEPLYDMIASEIEKTMGTGGTQADKARRNLAFKNTVQAALEHIAIGDPNNFDLDSKALVTNGRTLKNFAGDMNNVIQFERGFLFDEPLNHTVGTTVANSANNFVDVRLDNGNSLLSSLFKNRFGDVASADVEGNAGYDTLAKFVKKLRGTEYAEAFEGFNHQEFRDVSPKVMATEITDRLRRFVGDRRSTSSSFGYANRTSMLQDATNAHYMVSSYFRNATDHSALQKVVQQTIGNTADIRILGFDGSNLKASADDLVSRIMMPISETEYIRQITAAGVDDIQKQALIHNFQKTRQHVQAQALDILEGIRETDLSLVMTKNNKLFLTHANGTMHAVDLATVDAKNGTLFARAGNTRHVIQSFLDMSRVAGGTFDRGAIQYNTTYGEAMKKGISFKGILRSAMKRKGDTSSSFLSALEGFKQNLRTTSPAIESFNPHVFQEQLEQNIESLVTALPEIHQAGILNRMQQQGILTAEDMKFIEPLLKTQDVSDRVAKFSEMRSTQRNAFVQSVLTPLMRYIGEFADDKMVRHFATNFTTRNKDTHLTEGKGAVGSYVMGAGTAYENLARPPVTQVQNLHYYDKGEVEAALKQDPNLANVRTGALITTKRTRAMMTDRFDETTGKTYTSTVTSKYASVDTASLRKLIVEEAKGNDNAFRKKAMELGAVGDEIDEVAAELKQRAMNANLYEQEIVIDSRLHDVVMNKMDIQTIGSHKELELLHENELITNQNIQRAKKLRLQIDANGHVSYSPGLAVQEGELLLRAKGYAGASQPYVSKYRGKFKGGYFNGLGMLVDEATLNSQIQGLTTEQQIKEKLDSLYDFKFYVTPVEDRYGHKVFQGMSEKGVVNPLKAGLGDLSPAVRRALLTDDKLKHEIGVIHTREDLEKRILPAVERAFGKDMANAIMAERHAVSDILFRGLSPLASTGANIMINQNVPGHKNMMIPIKSAIGLLRENKALDGKVADIFSDKSAQFINGELVLKDDMDGTFIDINKLDEMVKDLKYDTSIKDANGNVIGHHGWTELTQVHDYMGGTHQGPNMSQKYLTRARNIQSTIAQLKKKSGNEFAIKKLEARLINMEDKIAAEKHIDRGLKYSDRMHQNLNRLRYDDDLVEGLRDNLSADEFDQIAGGIMKNGSLDESLVGKSVLSPITNRIANTVLSGDGDIRLSQVKGLYKDGRYDYLLNSFNGKMHDQFSVKKAEMAYSLSAGAHAHEFNIGGSSAESLRNGVFKFNDVKIGELDVDVDGQASSIRTSANNPYTNNLMIDLGAEFGSDRHLAVGRSLDRVSGDSIVKPQHIQDLSKLKSQYRQLETLKSSGATKAEVDAQMSKILETRSDIITQQQADLMSKNGIAGDMIETRMYESHLGKGAGIAVIQNKMEFTDMTPEAIVKRKQILRAYNPQSMFTAQVHGKSLMDHYAEGKLYDAQWRSVEAFRDMGYFNKDVMKKRLGKEYVSGDVAANEEKMMQLLERHGDIGITTRFPEIMEGSDKLSMIYLDRSLAGNEARALGHTGASMKLDFDGDSYFWARVKTSRGESYLDAVMNAQHGRKISGELDEMVRAQRIAMTSRAVGQNRYFDARVQKELEKGLENAIKTGSLMEVSKDLRIEGRVYAAQTPQDFAEALRHQNAIKPYLEQAVAAGFQEGKQDFNDHVGKLLGGNQDLIKSFAIDQQVKAWKLQNTAKILKTTIGEANTTNFKMRKLYDTFFDSTVKGFSMHGNILQSVLYEAEEGVISSKKAEGVISPERAELWNKSINGIIAGRDVETNLQQARNWMLENIDKGKFEDQIGILESSSAMFRRNTAHMDTQQKINYMVDSVTDTLRAMSNNHGIKQMSKALRFGENSAGITGTDFNTMVTAISDNSLSARTLRAIGNLGFSRHSDQINLEGRRPLSLVSNGLEISDGRDWATGPSTVDEVKGVLMKAANNFGEMLKNTDGKTLAYGALGLAGAYMIAGFVGGNPSRPAETHAADEAGGDDAYSVPSLQDQQMQAATPGQSGYVVNVRAQTNGTQQHAQAAMQNAVSRTMGTNVNIAMNITNSGGNIDNRYVESLLAGAIN